MRTPPFLDLTGTARAYHLPTTRGEFAVHDTGGAHDGTTALLVPGFTGSKEDFVAVLAPLAARGHRVVALDQRGQHETPGPDDAAAYGLDELGEDLLAVITALGDGPVHLLGHSFGGLVSRAAVLARPGAFRSLTLLASGPGPVPAGPAQRLRLLVEALPAMGLPDIWARMRELDAAAGVEAPADPIVAEFLQARFLGTNAVGLRAMAGQLLETPDRTDELAHAGVPVLIAYGDRDDVWSPSEQAASARRLGARAAVITGAGHSPAAELPDDTAAVLADFWDLVGAAVRARA